MQKQLSGLRWRAPKKSQHEKQKHRKRKNPAQPRGVGQQGSRKEQREMPANNRSGLRGTGVVTTSLSQHEKMNYPHSSVGPLLSTVRERRVLKVLKRIEDGGLHSVGELARGVRLSPAHLQRLFKQETGVHISDLLTERRLSTAAHLLATTEMEIKEVAYFVGYQHHSSFVRAFQRRFRQTPKRYRHPPAA